MDEPIGAQELNEVRSDYDTLTFEEKLFLDLRILPNIRLLLPSTSNPEGTASSSSSNDPPPPPRLGENNSASNDNMENDMDADRYPSPEPPPPANANGGDASMPVMKRAKLDGEE